MGTQLLMINAVTKHERHAVISQINDALSASGAWIENFNMYSNKSIAILFGISIRDVSRLHHALKRTEITLYEESEQLLRETDLRQQQLADAAAVDLYGTVQVTFVHDEPDVKRHVPAFG
ncbi:MAG: hypothetical protein ACM32O_07640 [Clostridia bacterium]